jgi:hypothetical protein
MFDAPAPRAGSGSAARDTVEHEQAACQTSDCAKYAGSADSGAPTGFHDETPAFRMKRE